MKAFLLFLLLLSPVADDKADFSRLRAQIAALLEEYAKRFDATPPAEPPAEPPVGVPTPVELPHAAEAYRKLLVSPDDFGPLRVRTWNAPPRVGDVTMTEDTRRANMVCDALSSSELAVVLDTLENLPLGNRNIRDWWDNDVHGRAEFPWLTMLRLKAASLGHAESVRWIKEMREGDPLKYSPYRIANTLIAWGSDGGLQQTGKHYPSGWAHGYEGMFANTPFLLLYVWQKYTGEDLISRIPFYTNVSATIKARIKPYYETVGIGPRSSFTVANLDPTIPGIESNREGLVNYPLLQPQPEIALPENCWFWRRGDGVVMWSGDVNIDVSAPGVGGQRAEFVPRCFGFMDASQTRGLPFVHGFKGGLGPRSCSGLMLGPIDWSSYIGIGTSYKRDGGFDRPNSAEESLLHLNPAPQIDGDSVTLTWPALHGRRGTNSDEEPNNVSSRIANVGSGILEITDHVTYKTAKPVTLTFTLSAIPSDAGIVEDGKRVFRTAWGSVKVTADGISRVQVNTEQLHNRDANHMALTEVYNPYKLEIIQAQLFVEYSPATEHKLETVVTIESESGR